MKSSSNKSRIYYTLLFTLFLASSLMGQGVNRPYRWIATNEYMEKVTAKGNPVVKTERYSTTKTSSDYSKTDNINVLVAVHVLSNGFNNISDDDVFKQIEVLNRYFNEGSRMRGDAKSVYINEGFNANASTVAINFCLISNGNEAAIYRYECQNKWSLGSSMMKAEKGGVDLIDPHKIVNVVVTDLDAGMSGFAQMPGYSTETDAIVIDNDFFGLNPNNEYYGEGKTLVHLIGNFFGLKSLWQPDCGDDGVEDTPIHNSPNYGCGKDSHYSICGDGEGVEMSMNFMDNSDDPCMGFFTYGQKTKFYSSLMFGGERERFNSFEGFCSQSKSENMTHSRIYPNPFKNNLSISLPEGISQGVVLIKDEIGRTWHKDEFMGSEISASTNNFPVGIYFIEIYDPNGSLIFVHKAIRTK